MSVGEELRALHEAATPGPWTIVHDDGTSYGYVGDDGEIHPAPEPFDCLSRGTDDDGCLFDADARIAAWLRNRAEALAGLIEAAERVADRMTVERITRPESGAPKASVTEVWVDPADMNALRTALAAVENGSET